MERDSLSLRWRYLQTTGKPVLKFNVRVSDLSGRVLFEKVAYKPHVHFHHLPAVAGLRAEVSVMTAAGLSAWSQPVVYRPQGAFAAAASPLEPSVEVLSVRSFDDSALVRVNLTAPGALLCSYYAASVRPAFAQRPVRHAGHARVLLQGLRPATEYAVECSLHARNATAQSARRSFRTRDAAAARSALTITDVEPFATFARVRVRSETPGEALCLPQRRRFGQASLAAFARLAKRFHVGERRGDEAQISNAGEEVTVVTENLHRGSGYRLQCMMEHELLREMG